MFLFGRHRKQLCGTPQHGAEIETAAGDFDCAGFRPGDFQHHIDQIQHPVALFADVGDCVLVDFELLPAGGGEFGAPEDAGQRGPSCFNPYIKNELLIHGHIHFGNIQCDMSSKKPVNVGIDRWYSMFRDDFSLHDFGYFNNNRKVFEFFPNLYNNEFDIKHINYNEVYSVYINTIRKIDSIMKSELPYLI